MKRDDINVDELIVAYQAGTSASLLAKQNACSVWSVINRLRKAGIEVRSANDQNARYVGDKGHKADLAGLREIWDGLMLGDGSYNLQKYYLRLEQRKEKIEWLTQLQALMLEKGCESNIISVSSKEKWCEDHIIRSGEGNLLYTVCYKELRTEAVRWYPDGIKRVPKDVLLTPQAIAHWLAGDGTAGPEGTLRFCTNGFLTEEVQFLGERLKALYGIETRITHDFRNQPSLVINHLDDAYLIANLVRPFLPDCFQYKLRLVRPKPKNQMLSLATVALIRDSQLSDDETAQQFKVAITAVRKIKAGKTYTSPNRSYRKM